MVDRTGWFFRMALALPAAMCLTCTSPAPAPEVPRWTRFELDLTSSGLFEHPLQEVEVRVEFTSPAGTRHTVLAFWDGERSWKARFSPGEVGQWSYRTSSDPFDPGLAGITGGFQCVPYSGSNPVFLRGPIQVSKNRLHLVDSAGTPFFWMADTAWNGPLRASAADWQTYLEDRRNKEFTVIQFVTTQWRAAETDEQRQVAFSGSRTLQVHPDFYRRLDQRVDAINEAGLVAAPVLLWALPGDRPGWSPGVDLPEDQLILLARYSVARYGAHRVVWILSGDGDYRGERAEKWIRIGRAVFGNGTVGADRLVTMHPMGRHWVADEFRQEDWYGFVGYQSGHGDSEDALRWLVQGPPALQWNQPPLLPVINLEPNYEGHVGYTHKRVIDAHAVRRAAYWSLLVTPPAGVSYGAHGIWSWNLEKGTPLHHPGSGEALPWYEALQLPGSAQMHSLARLFTSLEWWRLRPAPELLASQPGEEDPRHFVPAALSESGRWALLYLPERLSLSLNLEWLPDTSTVRWFNPRTGEWEQDKAPAGVRLGPPKTFTPPSDGDWILWIGPQS